MSPPLTSPKTLHLWVPELFSTKGGIQVYSQNLIQACREALPQTSLTILSKHDPPQLLPKESSPQYRTAGTWPERFRTLGYAALLARFAWQQHPELVIMSHLHFSPAAFYLRPWIGRYWIVLHGIEAWDISSPRLQRALAGAEKILTVSHYTQKKLQEKIPLPDEKFFLLPNTVDSDRFTPTEKPDELLQRYNLTKNSKILLTVGRLERREQYKGYDLVLQALPDLLRRIPDIHYLLVGTGSDLPRLREKILSSGLERHVTLTGFVPDEELSAHYNLSDVFVMPSKGEGFGIVYLEALACGRPVVAGNLDASPEPLLHGDLGALIDPDSLTQLTETLLLLLSGQHPNRHLYDQAYLRRRVMENFSLPVFFRQVRDLFPH